MKSALRVVLLVFLFSSLGCSPPPGPVRSANEIPFLAGPASPDPGAPRETIDRAAEVIAANEARGGLPRVHLVVQFVDPRDGLRSREFASQGIHILDSLGGSAWFAAVTTAGLETLEQDDRIRSATLPTIAQKSSPDLNRDPLRYQYRRGGRIGYRAIFFGDVFLEEALGVVAGVGGVTREVSRSTFDLTRTLDIALPRGGGERLVGDDLVMWLEGAAPPPERYTAAAAELANVPPVTGNPLSLSGAGVRVGIWDGGQPEAIHPDIFGRVSAGDSSAQLDNHATAVAGIIAGDGSGNAGAKGMAPGATLLSFDWDNDIEEMIEVSSEVRVANHSWGETMGWGWGRIPKFNQDQFGAYTSLTRERDQIVFRTGMSLVQAAGNDADDDDPEPGDLFSMPPDCQQNEALEGLADCIPPRPAAKNVITVGAANTNGTGVMAYSGRGPTDDGRIKPDLIMDGEDLDALMNGAGYASFDGTSSAAPGASGILALLHERADTAALDPRPSSFKAALIHTAQDVGQPGPSFDSGWGLPDAEKAVALLWDPVDGSCVVERLVVAGAPGTSLDLPLCVAPDASEIKVTIAWDDPPAVPNVSRSLVNDLDLQVIEPDGTTMHLPWRLDPSRPQDPAFGGASGGDDDVNNVEQVVVSMPENRPAGVWTARIVTEEMGIPTQVVSVAGVCSKPDADRDGVLNCLDNCPTIANPDQLDSSRDGEGDACERDSDVDGVEDDLDNCPHLWNADQLNTDGDQRGDACDPDDDNDCVADDEDNCPKVANCGNASGQFGSLDCSTNCGDRVFELVELDREIGRLARMCSAGSIDPGCVDDGCDWPDFRSLPDRDPRALLGEIAARFGDRSDGLKVLDDGRVRMPMEALGYSDGVPLEDLPDPAGVSSRLDGEGASRDRLCAGVYDRVVSTFNRAATSFDTCVEATSLSRSGCQADSDRDGVGDACDPVRP